MIRKNRYINKTGRTKASQGKGRKFIFVLRLATPPYTGKYFLPTSPRNHAILASQNHSWLKIRLKNNGNCNLETLLLLKNLYSANTKIFKSALLQVRLKFLRS